MDIFALTWQVMLGWRDSQSCSWRQQTVYRCSWQWGMDAHLCILYGLYLIFLRGGRLNQQRPSSGQSASRRRVLHPPPPPLSHSSHCCISFCILCHFQPNAWTWCRPKCRTCARRKKMTAFYILREIRERISTIQSVWGPCFRIRELLLRWGIYCNFSHFVHYVFITPCQPRLHLSEPMLGILHETLWRLYLGVRACFLMLNAESRTVLARVQELDSSWYKRKKKHWYKLKKYINIWYTYIYLLYAHKLFSHHSTLVNYLYF